MSAGVEESVTFEIVSSVVMENSVARSAPTRTPLSLKTVNGGITVGTVDSRVDIRTTNGGVKLSHMAGDVEGRTTNGGIDVDLDGTAWNGGGLDLETTNGGSLAFIWAVAVRISSPLPKLTISLALSHDVPWLPSSGR